MEDIRDQALDRLLTAFPNVEDSVLSCVQMCTNKPEDISDQRIKSIVITNFVNENQEDLDQIKNSFYERKEKDKKANVNESVMIEVLADIMCDGIQLLDNEELIALTLDA